MNFKRYLNKAAVEVDRELEKILKEQLKKAEKTDRKLISLVKAFTRSCRGGKKIRGTLVKLGYEIARGKDHSGGVPLIALRATIRGGIDGKTRLGGKIIGEIIKVGVAYEICHSAILAHDDIIDESLIRRGQPSLHAALGGDHYGISQTICLADYGFFLSYKIICETDFPDDCKIEALNLFSKVMINTTWGQMLDSEETDPLIVMKLKTAYYTIAGPLQIGAVLAGADQELIKELGKFGENLGIAFQIKDDILDSDVGSDVGSIEKAEKEAEEYKNRAMKVLPRITKEQKMSKLLQQMAEYLIERNK
ncbi:polyprenyl synthetase family protein [Patescibacteria group bacterium]|nr:polyprenyl synthetase family protein [Patescibacteria group bacterium]